LDGTVTELGKKVLGKAYRLDLIVENLDPTVLDAIKAIPGVVDVHVVNDRLEVETQEDLRAEVARVVVNHGGNLLMLGIETQSLDTIYTRYFEEVEYDGRS
jgi:ABC-2 type transport system ATP-binding protein